MQCLVHNKSTVSIFSSGGGLVLSYIVERYHGIAVFNPVVNGM